MSSEATSTGTVDRVALLLKVLAESEGDASVASGRGNNEVAGVKMLDPSPQPAMPSATTNVANTH